MYFIRLNRTIAAAHILRWRGLSHRCPLDTDKTMAWFTMLSLMRSTRPPFLDLQDESSIHLLSNIELSKLWNLQAPKSLNVGHGKINLTLVP